MPLLPFFLSPAPWDPEVGEKGARLPAAEVRHAGLGGPTSPSGVPQRWPQCPVRRSWIGVLRRPSTAEAEGASSGG